MIRAEALARGRLFSRFLILLAGLLAVIAMIRDASAAGTAEAVPAETMQGQITAFHPWQTPGQVTRVAGFDLDVAVRVFDLFALDRPAARPVDAGRSTAAMGATVRAFGITRGPGNATPLSADLALGGLCLLAAALLLWIAGQRRYVA